MRFRTLFNNWFPRRLRKATWVKSPSCTHSGGLSLRLSRSTMNALTMLKLTRKQKRLFQYLLCCRPPSGLQANSCLQISTPLMFSWRSLKARGRLMGLRSPTLVWDFLHTVSGSPGLAFVDRQPISLVSIQRVANRGPYCLCRKSPGFSTLPCSQISLGMMGL